MIPQINIEYPSYTVVTPQTLLTYKLRSLTVNDELNLKASITDEDNSASIMNRTIFNCIIEKPEQITDFKDWLKKTTAEDHKSLMYALYHCSYGDDIEYTNSCPYCNAINSGVVKLSKGIKINNYEGAPLEILDKDYKLSLEISKADVYFKYPTVQKSLDLGKNIEKVLTDNIEPYLLYIDKIVYGDKTFSMSENNIDLITMFKILPAKDRKSIDKFILNEMNKYTINASYRIKCSSCAKTYKYDIDFVVQFFRQLQ
jgi:hypothetical protein